MARTAEEVRRARPERLPPHNLEAEESVLGSMMLSGEAIASVVEAIKPGDFYRPAHQRIYQAILGIYGRGEPVDAITTVEELKRSHALAEVGGPLYLYNLVETVPTPASAAYYARIVADHALLRRLIEAASQIMSRAYSVPDDPRRAADEAEGLIYAVARQDEKDQVVTLRELVDDSMAALEHIQQRESAFAGVPTGFVDVDTLLSGLQKGNLIVIAARPGVGKSSFVTNIARNVAVDAGQPVAMFSLEMSRFEIGMRLLCGEARVPWDKVRSGRMATEEWTRIVEAAEDLHESPLYIVDSGNVTIVDIRAKARRMKSKHGLGLIIVDYLQLMSGHHRTENRQQEVAEISRSLKLLAKELEVPVIAVSQLNRNPESRGDKRPQLSDLRECVTGETLVSLADGRRVPIRELVGTTPRVLAMSAEGRIVQSTSDKVWSVGYRPVFRVRLASGREIRATGRHRLYGANGWVRVEDLIEEDRIAIARRVPEPSDVIEWPEARVALLGQLIGDGSYLSNQPLRYTTSSEENSRIVTEAARSEFGTKVNRYAGRGNWHQLLLSGNGNRWHPAGLNLWLRELGIFGQRSHEKRVPREVFRLSNEQLALFLRHLWATDGCIWVRPATSRGASRVYFASCSRGLADDVAALLLRMGIVSRIRSAAQGRYAPLYTVDVSGAEAQMTFLRAVGSFGERCPARELSAVLAAVRPNTNIDTLPREVSILMKQAVAAAGIRRKELARIRGVSEGSAAFALKFSPSRTLVAEYADILDNSELRSRASSDLFWDRVVAIEADRNEEVFDLTVPGPTSWLADGIVNHNSGAIEQDSDIVMFIHREDSDDPTVKGRADLIVAKHRNGPTANIPLTFLPHLTLFRNFART